MVSNIPISNVEVGKLYIVVEDFSVKFNWHRDEIFKVLDTNATHIKIAYTDSKGRILTDEVSELYWKHKVYPVYLNYLYLSKVTKRDIGYIRAALQGPCDILPVL